MHSPPLRQPPANWRTWLSRRRGRVLAGAAIALAGLLLLLRDGALLLADLPPPARMALVGGCWAAAATAAGTLPILLSHNFSQRSYDAALGLGGGIMLAATSFSLVLPALAASRAGGAGAIDASLTVGGGILLGMALVMLLGHLVQSDRVLQDANARAPQAMTRAWLFVAAVAIHNLPEGVAIGVGYGGVDAAKAHTLATGIAIQDIPEGLVVALALRAVGYGRAFSALLGAVSGLVEPLGAVAGALLIEASTAFLPWGLAGAAGAMLYVICHDVVPEAQRHGHCNTAAGSLVVGFIVMMVLDTALS
ncbi:ZIP family zinc transporter [Duganella sp. SG902]|uniref:ZIP family metal transporter n=1 Tax=Duganella sp. SG902 TaxID=2587016 RepID=UPI00159E71D6|nr:ZIP family metal transporter [Duganella sp. SG902]NVM74425.1 ZIP family zinc transporter [Duganella sp. SG902]